MNRVNLLGATGTSLSLNVGWSVGLLVAVKSVGLNVGWSVMLP